MDGHRWFTEYNTTRYLRELPDDALSKRAFHIANNLWSTGPNSEVTPPRQPENRQRLIRIYVHTIAEQVSRGRIVDTISEAEIRKRASHHYIPPNLNALFTGSPDCWVKFGKREHIREAFERGILRATLASSYNDPSLNEAQRDDELSHFARTPNWQLNFRLLGINEKGQKVHWPHRSVEFFEGTRSNDFYVWCCSAVYDARNFSDFEEYDAASIIRNRHVFSERLREAMRSKLPSTSMHSGRIEYYDPYDINPIILRPIFSKNFSYMYQNEYRFAWGVAGGQSDRHLYLDLGQLSDICEMLELRAR